MFALVVAIVVTVADQWTKEIVRSEFVLADPRVVIPGWLNLTYLRNTGAAWGMFGGQNTGLILLSVFMLGAMVVFRRSFLSDTFPHRLALGLLVGGIVGNLLDRLRLGYVTDFLDVHWRGHHWPTFNVADTAICLGVGVYMLSTFLSEYRRREPAAGPVRISDDGTEDSGPGL